MNNEKVVAKVNDVEITSSDVERFLVDIGPQMAAQFQSEEGINRIIEELVNQELLSADAIENKIDESDEFLEVLEDTKDKLLKSFALTKLISEAKIEESEIKKYYDENKEKFTKAETAVANHILVETEEEANAIIDEINNGLSFADAAMKYSTCPSKDVGGNLGEFSRGQMVPEFEDAVFEMKKGDISSPVKTQFGYHIIELLENNPAGTEELEDVEPAVRENLLRLKQQERYLEKIEELKKSNTVEIY